MKNILLGLAVLVGINLILWFIIKLFAYNKYVIISIAFAFGVFFVLLLENINAGSIFKNTDFYRIALVLEFFYILMLFLFAIWFNYQNKLEFLKEIKIGILVSTILFVVFHFLIVNDVLYKYKLYQKEAELLKLPTETFISDDIDNLKIEMYFGKYQPTSVLYKKIIFSPSKQEIQAILYFDEKTFKQLLNKLVVKDQINIVLDYKWLPQTVRHEIATWKIQPYSYDDKIFNTPNGRFTILENKLIINFKNY